MKKVMLLLLAAICITTIASCSAASGQSATQEAAEVAEAKTQENASQTYSDAEYMQWTADDWQNATDEQKTGAAAAVIRTSSIEGGQPKVDEEYAQMLVVAIDMYFEEQPDGSLREVALESQEALLAIQEFLAAQE